MSYVQDECLRSRRITFRGMAPAGTLQDLLSRQMQSGGGKLYSDLDVCRQVLDHASQSAFQYLQHLGLPRAKPASFSCYCMPFLCTIHSLHRFSTAD